MEGKNIFTTEEVQMIKKYLKEKSLAGSSEQKTIRHKMRKIGFYISDFSANKDGFNLADFDALIRSGRIKVIGSSNKPVSIQTNRKIVLPVKKAPTVKNSILKSTKLPLTLQAFKSNRFDFSVDHESIVPDSPGTYILCLKSRCQLPTGTLKPIISTFQGLKVIYTGIASKSLRKRDYRQHFKGNNAGRSTLRKSLGVLFGYKQIPRDRDPQTGKTKFEIANEIKLTEWMCGNLVMYFLPTSEFNKVEIELINHFNPPLNLKDNRNSINSAFRQMLSQLRARNS